MRNLNELDEYRVQHPFIVKSSTSGAFKVFVNGRSFMVIASIDNCGASGMMEHISVTMKNQKRCPTWEEMSAIKDMFFLPEEECVQFHPKHSKYVNLHEYCLHIWRPVDGNLRRPEPPEQEKCFVVLHRNYADGSDAAAYRRESDAKAAIEEEKESVLTELKERGYEPTILRDNSDNPSVYVADSDIYYEWEIIETTIE